MFGSGTARIETTFNASLLRAGRNLSVLGAMGGPFIHLIAFTDLLGAGSINVRINGNVRLTETAGDLRAGDIVSTLRDVTLTAPLSIVDATGDAFADVSGNNLTLTAVAGSIGAFVNDLEIDSALSGPGFFTATANGAFSPSSPVSSKARWASAKTIS